MCNLNRQSEKIFRRLRLGILGLHFDLYKLGIHPTGKCDFCSSLETVTHYFMECRRYLIERAMMFVEINIFENDMKMILKSTDIHVQAAIVRFVQRTKRFAIQQTFV